MASLLLRQPFCSILKRFNYNELGFLQAAFTTVEAAFLEELVFEISRLFANGWYAWQDSNLRPVAPEATALSI